MLADDLSARELRSLLEIIESREFRVLLDEFVSDPAANDDRKEDAIAVLLSLIRACRNRREQLENLKDGIVAYKNGGGLTLLGAGIGALLSGIPAGIVPIGADYRRGSAQADWT